jgi:hypothetical protein
MIHRNDIIAGIVNQMITEQMNSAVYHRMIARTSEKDNFELSDMFFKAKGERWIPVTSTQFMPI